MMKILVVDDLGQWRSYHKSALNVILENIEYELVIQNSATEAYKNIIENTNNTYNLIITDLQMEECYEPDYAGEWLVKNVQKLKQYVSTPIIIVSAAPNIKYIAQQLNVNYISKPTLIHNPLAYELKIKELLNI